MTFSPEMSTINQIAKARTKEQVLFGLNVQLRILKAGLREGAKDPDLPRLIADKEAEIARLSA